jgi:hypothetical protein
MNAHNNKNWGGHKNKVHKILPKIKMVTDPREKDAKRDEDPEDS